MDRVGTEAKKTFTRVQDSGERQAFTTGSQRDTRQGKGRYDLIPPEALRRLAIHFENGAIKYLSNNWALGQPLSRYMDSASRHLEHIKAGHTDEDHAAALMWNAMAYMVTEHLIDRGELPQELNDMVAWDQPGVVDRIREQIAKEQLAKAAPKKKRK